jgi:MFS transporter, PHS family, inorganic phosphate transporter
MGSVIAQAAIAPLRTRGATAKVANPWQNHVMQIYSLFMFLGIFTTLLIPETARKTLEELAGEYNLGDETITGDNKAHSQGSDELAATTAEKGIDAEVTPVTH